MHNSILTTEADSDYSLYSSCLSAGVSSDEEMIESETDPTQVMEERHSCALSKKIPEVDFFDATNKTGRQLAPELSADIFKIMLQKEKIIGDYITNSPVGITRAYRESMVSFIQTLHRLKRYRAETFYIAVSIADRYLATLTNECPYLALLSVTTLIMAAKLNEPINPSFAVMNQLLTNQFNLSLDRDHFIALETKIIFTLEFDMQWISPAMFLERF